MKRFIALTCLLVLLPFVAPHGSVGTLHAQAQAAGWYDVHWVHRRPVTIVNLCGQGVTNYQVRVALDASSFDFSHAESDGRDLRVTDSTGTTLIPFWIEEWNSVGATASVWVRVPSIPTGGTTLYLYYGNPSATPASDGIATFELFDDTWCPWGTPCPGNPVHTAGQPWWEATVSYPVVFEDASFPGRPRFHMLYDGHQVIGHAKGYAWSSDLNTWTEYDAGAPHPPNPNPIMGQGYTGNAQFAWGDVIKVGSTYYLFVSRGPGTTVRAESTDLTTWTNFVSLATDDPGGIGTGAAILKEGDGITPIAVDGRYWMVYFHGNSPGSMYLASSPVGGNLLSWSWTGAAVLTPTPGGWDQSGLWTPSFARLNNRYYIYYQGNGPDGWEIGFGAADAYDGGGAPIRPDLAGWAKSDPDGDGNPDPVIRNGSSGSWDSTYCIDPMIRRFDGVYYVFYTGNTANGYATSSSPEGPWTKFERSTNWSNTGSPTVASGILSLGSGASVTSLSTFQYRALGYRARFAAVGLNTWGGFITGSTGARTMIGTVPTSGDSNLYLRNFVSGTTETRSVLAGSWLGAFHVYEILWSNGRSVGIVDHGASTTSLTAAVPSTALPVTFYNYNDPTNPLQVDWVFVRQHCGAEPQLAVGPEQRFGIALAKTPARQTVDPGADVSFTITVTNTGDVELTNVLVADALAPNCARTFASLDARTSVHYTCTALHATADWTNQATVTANVTASGTVSDSATAFVDVRPALAIAKTAEPPQMFQPGGTVAFTVRVTNSSAEPVTLTTLTDSIHGNLNGQGTCSTPQVLGPAGIYTCVFNAVVSGSGGYVETDQATVGGSDDEANYVEASASATVTIIPAPTIVVAPTSLRVREPNGSAMFSIRLTYAPTAPVSIGLSTSNDQCAVSPLTAVLNATNWQSGVNVTVSAVNDDIADGDQTCIVYTAAASSSDPYYNGLNPADVTVTVEDDDHAAIVVAPTSLTVSEPDGSAAFAITLTSQPIAPVSIGLSTSNGQCAVSTPSAVLNATNWRSGVNVTVTAVDDGIKDGDQTCIVLTAVASSADPNYNGLNPANVTVTVRDDEVFYRVLLPTILRYWPPKPGKPELYPINNPSGVVTYTVSWGAAQWAETYVLQEAKDSAFIGAKTVYTGPVTSYEATERGAARYYYRVKGCNSWYEDGGDWSKVEWVDVLWEKEPNHDALTQANGPLVSGVTYYGTFTSTADIQDYFYFVLPTAQTVELWLTNIPTGHNYDLILRDEWLNSPQGWSSRNLDNAPEHIGPLSVPAGRYYIQVYHTSGAGSPEPYHLKIVYQ